MRRRDQGRDGARWEMPIPGWACVQRPVWNLLGVQHLLCIFFFKIIGSWFQYSSFGEKLVCLYRPHFKCVYSLLYFKWCNGAEITQVADAFTPRICNLRRGLQMLHTNKRHPTNSRYDSSACGLVGVVPGLEISRVSNWFGRRRCWFTWSLYVARLQRIVQHF